MDQRPPVDAPVDIMMPFYGDPGLFRTAVESVLAQTDPKWRLVVIDDQYPDPSPARWLQDIGDPRIEYQRNDVNLGVGGNFRRAVELSRAPLVTIMGCDDVLLPGYVERMRELAELFPDAAYFQPGVRVIDATGAPAAPLADRVKRHYRPKVSGPALLAGERAATSLARGNWTYFPSICWRRRTLVEHGFDEDMDVALDLDLQLRCLHGGASLAVDDVVTFEYRRHGGSVSSWSANDGSRFSEERDTLDRAARRARERGWRSTARAARVRLSSRLSASTRLPAAVRARDMRGIGSLLGHILLP